MNCPACKVGLNAVSDGPSSHSCGSCGGHWVPFERHESWLNAGAAWSGSAAPAPTQGKRLKARVCPRCGRIMGVARLSNVPLVEVERCGGCNGVWFDKAEMEWAGSTGVLKRLYHVLNDSGQRRLEQERESAEHEGRVRAVLGAEVYTETQRIKAWLDAQPQRATILAVLTGDERVGG